MNRADDIRKELRELDSPLADMSRAMPYHVPEEYFEGLTGNLCSHSKLALEEEPVVAWHKAMPYDVPKGYFEGLPDAIMAKVRGLLPAPAKTNPYEVPAGYFDNLAEQVLQKAKEEEKPNAKVIPLKLSIWKQVRWAAAAVLLLCIGIGSYTLYNNDKASYNVQAALAEIPKDSINTYVQLNIDDFEMETLVANLEPVDMQALTNKLSKEEIEQYLDETGWDETMNL